jgi:hypothetical protein
MKRSAKGVETRRLYTFENAFFTTPDKVCRPRSLRTLKALAARVWAKHGRKRQGPPTLEYGPGTPHGSMMVSYAAGRKYIQLAPDQRNVLCLLHEITHSLGYGAPHGPGFVCKYMDLLVEYGNCDRGELTLAAGLFKLNLKG